VIERGGYQNYLFASDFLLEIGPDNILHEIEDVAEAPMISDADKCAVLRENARRFYQIRLEGLAAESAKVTKSNRKISGKAPRRKVWKRSNHPKGDPTLND
jgi:hypothetical protein